jgi:hypothetical protein
VGRVAPLATALSFGDHPLLAIALSFLSSRAKPRDLLFLFPGEAIAYV